VEFFASEKQWRTILERIKDDPYISFYAGNNDVLPRLGSCLMKGRIHDEYG